MELMTQDEFEETLHDAILGQRMDRVKVKAAYAAVLARIATLEAERETEHAKLAGFAGRIERWVFNNPVPMWYEDFIAFCNSLDSGLTEEPSAPKQYPPW